MITVLAVQPLLGQDPPAPPQGPEFGGSSPIGLVVTLFMGIALVFLIRSMNKHLRKVPPTFDPPEQERAPADPARPGDGPAPAASTAERPPTGPSGGPHAP